MLVKSARELTWHGLRPLLTTRLPASTVVLAVAPRLSRDTEGYAQRWEVAYARLFRNGGKRRSSCTEGIHATPEQLWQAVHVHCGYSGTTFLWTWDMSAMARTSGMLTHLPAAGWELDAFSVSEGAPWMVWRRKRATLKVCDVASVWPGTLDNVGKLFALGRRATPDWDGPALSYVAWARQDCKILCTAVDAYLGWVAAEDLGSLAVTGAGQAYRAFRRRFLTHGLLVHCDTEAREAERAAMWTGRCEALWRGALPHGPVEEWDLSRAHTRICAEVDLPVLLHGPADPGRSIVDYLDDDRYALLAEVDVETDTEVVPAFLGGGIAWPVGRFRTVLWTPELRDLLACGGSARMARGWLYRRAPALRDWAQWILDGLGSDDHACPPWRKHVLARWGNTLVGRFAMQYPQWTLEAWSPDSTVHCVSYLDADTGDESWLMQVGHRVWRQTGRTYSANAVPAVTGYVMSEMRSRLWRLMRAAPPGSVLYVDTDSLLVPGRFHDALAGIADSGLVTGLRLKRTWTGLVIYGPRQVVTGGLVRVSGVPLTAERTGLDTWDGEVTEGLLAALVAGRVEAVASVRRQWQLRGHDPRRAGRGSGWTRPHVLQEAETA